MLDGRVPVAFVGQMETRRPRTVGADRRSMHLVGVDDPGEVQPRPESRPPPENVTRCGGITEQAEVEGGLAVASSGGALSEPGEPLGPLGVAKGGKTVARDLEDPAGEVV